MVKIIAVLCSLSNPDACHELLVTSSDLENISLQSCLMGAPAMADWMRQHPAERLKAWRCVIGDDQRRGA